MTLILGEGKEGTVVRTTYTKFLFCTPQTGQIFQLLPFLPFWIVRLFGGEEKGMIMQLIQDIMH